MVAIDKHMIPRHDVGNMLHLVFSKRKGGTNKFEGMPRYRRWPPASM